MKNKYKSYQCQKCGEYIGWLGRFIEWLYGLIGLKKLVTHNCKKNNK